MHVRLYPCQGPNLLQAKSGAWVRPPVGDDATMEGEAMLFPAGSFRWKLERLDMDITQKNIGSLRITSLWCVAIAFLLILRPQVLNFIIIGMVELCKISS